MQFVRAASAAALFLLFGATVPAYAQEERQDERRARQKGGRISGSKVRHQPRNSNARSGKRTEAARNREANGRSGASSPLSSRNNSSEPNSLSNNNNNSSGPNSTAEPTTRASRTAPAAGPTAAATAGAATTTAWAAATAVGPTVSAAATAPNTAAGHHVATAAGMGTAGRWQGHSTWQRIVPNGGKAIIAPGRSVEAMAATTSPRTVSVVYFGSQHWFRMRSLPTMYMGYPRFEYGGYSFLLVDPWPEYWAENWYSADDVYIDYDDGYYLYNRRYPDVRLAITVAR